MKLLLFIALILFSTLSANKVLYLTHEKIPDRVVKGEVFFVTLKTISTVQKFDDITYEFSKQVGLKALNTIPYREQKGKFFFDTNKGLLERAVIEGETDVTASARVQQGQKKDFSLKAKYMLEVKLKKSK